MLEFINKFTRLVLARKKVQKLNLKKAISKTAADGLQLSWSDLVK